MPDANDLQWITVNDFSGGIRQVLNDPSLGSFSPQPVGVAAALSGSSKVTYDCIALPSGGIGPVPFAFNVCETGPSPVPDGGNVVSDYVVGGIHVPQYTIMDTTQNSLGTDPTEVFVTLMYHYKPGGGPLTYTSNRYRLYRSRQHKSPTDFIEVADPANALPFFDSGAGVGIASQFGFTPMCDYRSAGASAATTPGLPYVIIGVNDPSTLGVNTWQFPRPGFTNRVGAYAAIKDPIHLVSHQGRLVVNGYDTTGFQLGGTSDVVHNDDTFWTVPNKDTYDNGGNSSSLSQAVVGSYGCIASSSASELIYIKASSYGGLVISSDLNDPIITDYSTIQGTNGCHVDGCWTPYGYVYGAKDGSIYAYPGGGRSQDLAPQLESGFWHQDLYIAMGQGLGYTPAVGAQNQPNVIPYFGKMAYHSGYVFVPGNWLLDMSNGSWWRFRTPVDQSPTLPNGQYDSHYFATSNLGTIYSAPPRWQPAGALSYLLGSAKFGLDTPDDWKWTSQPIPVAKESEYNEVRELTLTIQAQQIGQTVQATVLMLPSQDTFTVTATATVATQPETFRFNLPSLKGTHASVTLHSSIVTGGFIRFPPPMVQGFSLGTDQNSMVVAT